MKTKCIEKMEYVVANILCGKITKNQEKNIVKVGDVYFSEDEYEQIFAMICNVLF